MINKIKTLVQKYGPDTLEQEYQWNNWFVNARLYIEENEHGAYGEFHIDITNGPFIQGTL